MAKPKKKNHRLGKWAEKLTKEEVSRRMRLLALRKHAKLTPKQRHDHAMMMVRARTTT